MECVQMKQVSKVFSGKTLLKDVSITIPRGTIVGISGPNGCGKSVLLKMVCGFYKPTSGEILVWEKRVDDTPHLARNVGAMINAPDFIPNWTGIDNLLLLAKIQNRVGKNQVVLAMKMVGLDPLDKTKVKHYSLGMKQKLGIAQSFMENQQLLLLDEPFNALDQKSHDNMLMLLKKFRDEGRTILLTSHNEQDLKAVCDVIYELKNFTLNVRN